MKKAYIFSVALVATLLLVSCNVSRYSISRRTIPYKNYSFAATQDVVWDAALSALSEMDFDSVRIDKANNHIIIYRCDIDVNLELNTFSQRNVSKFTKKSRNDTSQTPSIDTTSYLPTKYKSLYFLLDDPFFKKYVNPIITINNVETDIRSVNTQIDILIHKTRTNDVNVNIRTHFYCLYSEKIEEKPIETFYSNGKMEDEIYDLIQKNL